MRILFDIQALQNESRSRGIGRYVRSLLGALSARDDIELIALLNGAFSNRIADLKAELTDIVGESNILIWQGLKQTSSKHPDNATRARLSGIIFDEFVSSIPFDVLLTGSVFDGYSDDTTVSIGGDRPYLRAAIHYDLIPLLNPEQFFWDENYRPFYEDRLNQLSDLEILFAISNATAHEAALHLPSRERKIVPIGAAVDPSQFHCELPVKVSVLKALGIKKPFVLHVSTLEPRKNFDGLIRAFSKLPTNIRKKHQLVFVGASHPDYVKLLRAEARQHGLSADQLIICSDLDDDNVAQLYRQAALFCFPSLHEGFGLPPLEAMAAGCPTIGSNCSSIPEVIGNDSLLFDPKDESEIARSMARLLSCRSEASRASKAGLDRAKTFSWANVAERLVAALQDLAPVNSHASIPSINRTLSRFLRSETSAPSDQDASAVASALVANFDTAMAFRGHPDSKTLPKWRVEGPYDSSYSLALLNRETARSLEEKGYVVTLRSMKEPGNSSVNEDYVSAHSDLSRMHAQFMAAGIESRAIVSRNNYPPLVEDMRGSVRALHHYAWEESGFPAKWVDEFNQNLNMMTCLSEHVRKIMIDNGVSVPMLVSGCGVDHWERIAAEANYRIDGKDFRFLHVSSCFPRKGVEALLEAYGASFTIKDDVSLIIKTFHNPHNQIEDLIEQWRAKNPDYPDVILIFADLTDEELKSLYSQCDVMVGPSFAEGYGLPLAEAMLTGIPVITTAWGGQLDFCNDGNSWLVDFEFERARSHFNLWASAWAKADLQSLSNAMTSAFNSTPEARAGMAARGRRQLLAEHKWSQVTDRLSVAAQILPFLELPSVRLGWITTWNSKCGIATYSEHLIENLDCDVRIFSPTNEEVLKKSDHSIRSWRISKEDSFLGRIIDSKFADDIDLFIIQFNYGFYNHIDLGNFIDSAKSRGKKIVLFLHATHHPGDQFAPGAEAFHLRHMIPTLRQCDRLLVHSIDDLNRLKELGLVDNVALFPHGVISLGIKSKGTKPNKRTVVGTYGFALPHKGLANTVRAIGLLRERGHDFGLKMTNAQYPAPISAEYVNELRNLISLLDLEDVVDFNSDFLTDQQAGERLSACDLIVFPYESTEESASGAVRYGMAMEKPVMVSRNPIFKDLLGATYECEAGTSEAIAAGILEAMENIARKSEISATIAANAASWREEHAYRNLGRRLTSMCQSLTHQF